MPPQATTSWVSYWADATRSTPITKACSPAEGVDRMSRSTPPTEPDAAITEMARPSTWSLLPTMMPSICLIVRPALRSAAWVTS